MQPRDWRPEAAVATSWPDDRGKMNEVAPTLRAEMLEDYGTTPDLEPHSGTWSHGPRGGITSAV